MRFIITLLFLLPAAAQAVVLSIPQVADGDSWKTSLKVFSRTGRTALVSIHFYDDNGKALALPLVGRGTTSQLEVSIGPYDSVTIETEGAGNTLLVGWAHLESDYEVGGVAVFRQRTATQMDNEAAVPLSYPATSMISTFDNTGGFVTGVALVNNGPGPVTLNIGFTEEGGQTLGSRAVVLNSFAHTSFVVAERFPEVTGKRGTMHITATTYQATVEGSMTALGLRFNPKGSFTSVPFFVSILK
jgi:hypothetical protein